MRNETAKAELGRAGWKLLHTMGQRSIAKLVKYGVRLIFSYRYPDHPTPDERQTFKDFLFLFSRMYPCGKLDLTVPTPTILMVYQANVHRIFNCS